MVSLDGAVDAGDAAVADDAASDQGAVTDGASADVTTADATPVDAPAMDAPAMDAPAMDALTMDAPAMDALTMDALTMDALAIDAPAMDATPVDAPARDVPPADAGADGAPRDVALADAAASDVPPAPADASDGAVRAPCGLAGQPCCQNRVCIDATVCDTAAMRCVPFTPIVGECTSTLRCADRDVCGGIFTCGDHACLLCVLPGVGAIGSSCTTLDQCASAFCANGQCAAPCNVGPVGAAACAAMNPRMICAQFTSRPRADGGTPPTTTFGGCVLSCARNGDCGGARVCRLQRNDYDDRLDLVCGSPTGMIAPGEACDPNPPVTATAAMFCNNSQCIATAEHAGYCAPFCATDADCPSAAYACIGFMFGRPSGALQSIRMCARR